jgi:hypothetical protein
MAHEAALGIPHSTWVRIDALAATGLAMSLTRELMEKRGKNVDFGFSRKTWGRFEMASLTFALLFAFRNIFEAVDEYEGSYGVGSFLNPNAVVANSPKRFNEF